MEKMEARVALCKCKEGKRTYGVRFEKCGNGWKYNWAFPIKKESSARREGYADTQIVGSIEPSEEYPGCPWCGAKYFVVCSCGKLSCNTGSSNNFKCDWCGTSGTLTGYYNGSGISGGGDA